MRIGIDARMAGRAQTGIGVYIEELIRHLPKGQHQYVLFLRRTNWDLVGAESHREKRLADVPWYSLKEQTVLPRIFAEADLDLLHVPHFNVPLWYQGPFVVTIHDLTQGLFLGSKSLIRKAGYHAVLRHAVTKARHVIAVSRATREELLSHYALPEAHVSVVYEGIDPAFSPLSDEEERISPALLKDWYGITQPYILYVGVFRAHKNLPVLLSGFKLLRERFGRPVSLVLVGGDETQAGALRDGARVLALERAVIFPGFVGDREKLRQLYAGAALYVQPSRFEGFSLTPLEAVASGTPVLLSDIPVHHEVMGEGARYFRAEKPDELAHEAHRIMTNTALRTTLLTHAYPTLSHFRWERMADEVASRYNEILASPTLLAR